MKICIDASNLRRGGGRTHLIEFLNHVDFKSNKNIIFEVWGSVETLSALRSHPQILHKNHRYLEKNLFFRSFWQRFILSKLAFEGGSDIVFAPGGSYSGSFKPAVTMSRNMLPFEWNEVRRYFPSIFFIKLLFLRIVQTRSFRRVDGLIFLSNYAKRFITKKIGESKKTALIPHGINKRFLLSPRSNDLMLNDRENTKINVLYVSTIDEYKHHSNIIRAIHNYRNKTNLPVKLILIGSAYKPSLVKLKKTMHKYDPDSKWIDYLGPVPFDKLHSNYKNADIGIFGSTSENLPNILLEMMGAGLPILCSKYGPMPDILKDGGIYFDPLRVESLENKLELILKNQSIRDDISRKAHHYAQDYSWEKTASSTIDFLQTFNGK